MVLATRKEKSIQEFVEITFHIMVIVKIRSSGLFSKVNEFFDLAVNEGGCDNAGFTNKDIHGNRICLQTRREALYRRG